MALTIITYAMFISIIYGGVKHNLLIDREQLRQSLQNTEDPLCSCYSISVRNVSLSPTNNDEICYTYSIQYNDNLNICHNNEAAHIIFGICTHERPKFTSRKLRNSLKSIYPNNYNAKPLKLHRSSMLGIKIQNDINTFNSNEQITLCMKNINSEGITSSKMQYVLHNNDVISCKNHANHNGLPCISNQQQMITPQPTKPPISIALQPTTDDDTNSNTWQTTTYDKPTISPTETPTNTPTETPTNIPTNTITNLPTKTMTNSPLNAPVNNQLYDVCVDKFSLIQNIELTIKKHPSLNIMIIEIIGPSHKWFGFGFGETIMDNTYTITIENIEFNVFEYILPSSVNSNQVNSNKYDISTWNVDDIQINELNGKRIITIKRPYNVANTYDFTSFFECNINSIPIISAIGNDLNIGYHANRESGIINTNLCNCPTTNPETTTVSLPTVIETPIISDICIAFDQSCNLNNDECNTYKYWISEFLISLENENNNNNTRNINKRICLLGISQGVQILIHLNEINDIISIAQIIEEQSCGNSNTNNLYDALEIAELEFNTIIPNGNIKSLIIFSNCVSTNREGDDNENEICNTYNNINIHNNINIYIVNIQSIDGSLAGNKSNINDIYLNCLTNNNNDKIISITQNNFDNAQYEISKISDQIILNEEQHNDDGINDADAAFVNVIHMDGNDMNIVSKTKRNFVKWIFIAIMVVICLNALCFTICALRQSGSLDTCFGKIDINIDFDTDIDCLIIDDSLSDILSDSSIIINQ
eukprot:165704_1